ncbi:Hypothetical protein I5071_73520 [Sandaracinus amylolyticus]|nr:Hypothetical protein I5071_73520 [Sandaracinus amylolyticus]
MSAVACARPFAGRCAVVAADDHELRAIIADVLTADGFDVVTVADGAGLLETLHYAARGLLRCDLVVTDRVERGRRAISVIDPGPALARDPERTVPGASLAHEPAGPLVVELDGPSELEPARDPGHVEVAPPLLEPRTDADGDRDRRERACDLRCVHDQAIAAGPCRA